MSWIDFIPSAGQVSMIMLACIMMLLDIISGFAAACIQGKPSSSKMRQGLGHKALVLLIIAAAYALEVLSVTGGMPVDIPCTIVVCGYVTVMEFLSVLENVGKGYPEFKKSRLYAILLNSAQGDEPVNRDVSTQGNTESEPATIGSKLHNQAETEELEQ